MRESDKSVAFVVPCLNEQDTLGLVLTKIKEVCTTDFKDRRTEVIVCDNGSTDDSIKIAQAHGAKVVHCVQRGYGAALLRGIEQASCEIVVFADADNTYDLLETPQLVDELEKGYALVVGSRIQGEIHKRAMPFLHRYLGTPVLNFLLNLLYGEHNNKITDCNSGFRCFKRHDFLSWGIKSAGMEFASEMLVKALKSGAKISEVPISFYADGSERAPHLKTWRDGMRHLLQIFFDSPRFFFVTGCAVFVSNWLIIALGLFFGPVRVGFAEILGLHSMMFGVLGSLFGITIWAVGMFLAVRINANIRMYRYLIELPEDKLFWYSVMLTFVSVALSLVIVIYWVVHGFRDIYIEKQTLAMVAFASNGILLVWSVVTTHLLKRS